MDIEYRIIQEGKREYWAKSYIKGTSEFANSWDQAKFAFTLWGAKLEVKRLKKHYAYCEKHNLPKVVYEE